MAELGHQGAGTWSVILVQRQDEDTGLWTRASVIILGNGLPQGRDSPFFIALSIYAVTRREGRVTIGIPQPVARLIPASQYLFLAERLAPFVLQ